LRKDQEYTVALELGGPRNRLVVEGAEEAVVDLGTPLSGEPVWVGDYPGDDHFGPRFNIHPGMVGAVTVLYLGSAAADDRGLPAVASAQQRIGPDGGTVRLPDGTRLVFPAGAVGEPVPVKLERLAPDARFQGEGLVWDLLECTAPVKEFREAVELRVPLPAEFAGENASSVLVGFLEESYNAIRAAIGKVERVGDHAELVLSTTHFTNIVINRPRFPGRRTKLGTVLHVPWYGQGEAPGEKVGYCYAAALQMICEAVNPAPAPDHTVYNVVGQVGASPAEGFSAWDARWSEKIDPLIKARTGLKPESVERTIWYGAKTLTLWQDGLAGYLRSRIDLGYPIYLNGYRSDDEENPGSKERKPHAVVVVGYSRNPSTGAYKYYVHDPTKLGRNPAYDLRTPQQLGLDIWDITYPFATVALLTPCTATRLETLNVPNDAFQLIKRGPPARVYSFHWDHRTPQGYAWRLRGGAGVTEGDVEAIPADVDELRVSPDKNAVPVVNAPPRRTVWWRCSSRSTACGPRRRSARTSPLRSGLQSRR
jgi:hypothetical protein